MHVPRFRPSFFAHAREKQRDKNTLPHTASGAGAGHGGTAISKVRQRAAGLSLRGRRLFATTRVCLGLPCATAPRPFHAGGLSVLDLPSHSSDSPVRRQLGGRELLTSRHVPALPKHRCRFPETGPAAAVRGYRPRPSFSTFPDMWRRGEMARPSHLCGNRRATAVSEGTWRATCMSTLCADPKPAGESIPRRLVETAGRYRHLCFAWARTPLPAREI